MRLGLLGVVIAAGALAGCSLSADYRGTLFACDPGSACPDGYTCVDQRCLPDEPAAPTCTTSISAGSNHACAVRSDGTVWCWGDNSNGQLGDGTTTDRLTPVTLVAKAERGALPRLSQVVGGDLHSCAIAEGGAVWCWGRNTAGQLGNGTSDEQYPIQVVNLTGATALAAGDEHTCAIVAGGAVSCWGDNSNGQLGGPGPSSASPVTVPGVTGATAIAARDDSTCAVAQGVAMCWGYNADGQLGLGNNTRSVPPTAMHLPAAATSVALGHQFGCAVSGGVVYCTGDNADNELGLPVGNLGAPTGVDHSNVPVPIAISGVVIERVVTGDSFVCAVELGGGSLWCWGNNTDFELDDGTATTRPVPHRAGYTDGLGVSAGVGFLCVRSSDGLRCGGYASRGQLGEGNRITMPSPVAVAGLAGVAALTTGHAHTCAMLADGTAACWGRNDNGQLGDGTLEQRTHPVAVAGLAGITRLDAGDSHTCAIAGDAMVAMCWGDNSSGQLGDGALGSLGDRGVARPVASSKDPTAGVMTGVLDLALGINHTCALLADHSIRCWGSNVLLQTGVAVAASANRPPILFPSTVDTAMLPTPAVALAAGDNHTCALTMAGQVWCWGDNSQFQFGHVTAPAGTTTSVATPTQADTIENADLLAAGGQTTCVHTRDDKVVCWGNDSSGQLGNGVMMTNPYKMFAINNVTNVAALSVGNQHVCARSTDGTLTCWGANDAGQLTGAFGEGLTPNALTGLAKVTQVSAGYRHTCALLGDQTVTCWGSDRAGQLGDGQAEKSAPVAPRLECPK